MSAHRSWDDLSTGERRAVVVAGVVQVGLLAAAQLDLARRPADGVNGSKAVWRLVTLVNFVGPVAYFLLGRKDPG